MENKPLQVLLVEDNPGDARLYQEFLHESGLVQFELEHVEWLKTGLEHLAQAKPDAILLDLGLPDSVGLETFNKIYAQAPQVPIIVLTGLDDAEKAIQAVKAGAQDYLVKGEISGVLLVRAIRYAIERKRAVEALRESEEKWRSLVSASPDFIALHDQEGRYLFLNQYADGFTEKDIIGTSLYQYIHPESVEIFRSNMEKTLSTWTTQYFEFTAKGDGGVWRTYGEYLVPVHGKNQETNILAVARDITERKQADQQLKEREALLNEVGAIAKLGGWEMDITTGKATWSKGTYDIVEIDYNKPVPGLHEHVGYYLPEYREMIERKMQALIDTKQPMMFEAVLKTAKGNIKWCQALGEAVVKDGKLIKLRGTFQDITERKRTEGALQESEARFRSLYGNTPIGMYRTSPDGHILMANPALIRMLGHANFEELSQRDLAKEGYSPEYPRSEFQKRIEQAGQVNGFESAWKRKDGSTIYVLESAYLVRDEKDQPLYYEGTVEDITERTQAKNKLDEERNLLRTLIDNLPDRVYVKDVQGRKILSNLADWQASGGKTMEDVIGKTDFETYSPELAEKYWALDKSVIDTGVSIINREEPGLDSLGNPIHVLTSKVPIHDSQAKIVGLVGIGRDITELKQSQERTLRQLEHLTAMSSIDRLISANFDLKLSLSEILKHLTISLGLDAADILILDPDSQMLESSVELGFRTQAVRKSRLRLGEGLAGRTALERKLLHIPDLSREPVSSFLKTLIPSEGFVCYFGVPLMIKGQVKGVLEAFHRTPLEPDPEWLDFLNSLAGQTAIAIENATLFESLQRSNMELTLAYDETIIGWSQAMDLRDKETEGHTLRVTELTGKLAHLFDFNEKEMVQIRLGTLLHDIGKLGIPDKILLKPGPLTDEEWVLMKKHPTFAYEMLAPIHYLRKALDQL